jgi:3alpha(or 20beta)-hydroxysteroid dehydrogenase
VPADIGEQTSQKGLKMKALEGKVAIITGAARGQGAAEARLFVDEGAKVVLTDVNSDGAALAAQLGDHAHFILHDVADPEGWKAVVDATLRWSSRLDILVNNAGVYRPATLRDTDQALWDLHYRVNQLGVFLGMRSVVDSMMASGGGSIVNVSSNAGMKNVGGMFAYATSKVGSTWNEQAGCDGTGPVEDSGQLCSSRAD